MFKFWKMEKCFQKTNIIFENIYIEYVLQHAFENQKDDSWHYKSKYLHTIFINRLMVKKEEVWGGHYS